VVAVVVAVVLTAVAVAAVRCIFRVRHRSRSALYFKINDRAPVLNESDDFLLRLQVDNVHPIHCE
jgi:hypothetical protein